MTITEYKAAFENLAEEMEKEHGEIKYVLVQPKKANISFPLDSSRYIDCEIKF